VDTSEHPNGVIRDLETETKTNQDTLQTFVFVFHVRVPCLSEGTGAEEKRKITKIIPGTQTPQAGTGDSVSRFRRSRCSTVINYDSYFLVGDQICFQLLFTT